MTVSQLSKKIGISTSAIRYYESLGLIRAQRSDAGYRIFSPETTRLLEIIVQAKALGFSLKEIRTFSLSIQQGSMTKQKVRQELLKKVTQLDERIKSIRKFQKSIKKLLNTTCPNQMWID